MLKRLQISLHQGEIGGAAFDLRLGYVVAGVEHGGPGFGGLRDAVRHQMVGKLDIPDGRELFRPHLLRQVGNGGRRRLRLGPTAGESRVIVQVIPLREVPQGETVAEDDGPAGLSIEKHLKLPVQVHQLRRISFGILPVCLPVGAVQFR